MIAGFLCWLWMEREIESIHLDTDLYGIDMFRFIQTSRRILVISDTYVGAAYRVGTALRAVGAAIKDSLSEYA